MHRRTKWVFQYHHIHGQVGEDAEQEGLHSIYTLLQGLDLSGVLLLGEHLGGSDPDRESRLTYAGGQAQKLLVPVVKTIKGAAEGHPGKVRDAGLLVLQIVEGSAQSHMCGLIQPLDVDGGKPLK